MSTATITPAVEEGFFDWREMAKRINRSSDWVRRHTKELPHHRLPGGRVQFSDECVRIYMKNTLVVPTGRTAGSRARDKGGRR